MWVGAVSTCRGGRDRPKTRGGNGTRTDSRYRGDRRMLARFSVELKLGASIGSKSRDLIRPQYRPSRAREMSAWRQSAFPGNQIRLPPVATLLDPQRGLGESQIGVLAIAQPPPQRHGRDAVARADLWAGQILGDVGSIGGLWHVQHGASHHATIISPRCAPPARNNRR